MILAMCKIPRESQSVDRRHTPFFWESMQLVLHSTEETIEGMFPATLEEKTLRLGI